MSKISVIGAGNVGGKPSGFNRELKVIFSAINDTVVVGIRIESAIKPNLVISGITFSNVLAAPVEERMILLNTERFLRKSLAAALGTESKMLWVFVAA